MAYADIDAGKVLNKEGLLELSNQIKSYVDANAGGSSNNSFPMYVSGLIPSSRTLTKQEIIDKLLAGEVIYDPPRGTQITSQELANHSRVKKIGPYNVSTGTVNNSNSSSFTLNNDYYYYYVAGQKTSYQSYETAGVLFESSTGAFGLEMPYADNQLAQQKTPYYLQLQINSLNSAISSKQDAIIPSAPSADGTYMLKCVVSSGTPTYSWESVSVGGSY